ncbi:hypothetical protein [Limosilactobacillus mucosae]|uniref:hypothetical protein n=1 Tax=Limosilactobacillus mucosae TaxID=97478 RepID=UPI000942A1C6|nr:hypothetical protein [Limosilactobacillus mucosae]
MKFLIKLFYVLGIVSSLAIAVGFAVAIWFNGLIGLKVIATSFVSMAICMLVGFSLDIYQ